MMRLYHRFSFLILLLTLIVSCKEGGNNKISSFKDLEGQKVAVCTGTTHDLFLVSNYPNIIPFRVDSYSDIVAPIISGQAAAATCDITLVEILERQNSTLYSPRDTLFMDNFGMILKDASTRDDFNLFLKELKISGELARIIDKWYNDDGSAKIENYNFTGENGTFRVMADLFMPYYYHRNGEWCGTDVEIFSRYCKERGYMPKFETIPFSSGLLAITMGSIDAFCGGVTITEERKTKMFFSDPYAQIAITYIIPKANSATFSPIEGGGKGNLWAKISDSFYNNLVKENRYKLLLNGLKATLFVSIFSIFLGTLLGMLICWMSMSKRKFVKRFAKVYIEIIRGIPHLVLLMIMFYVVFASSGMEGTIVASITFAINFAAYSSEIFRTAIQSIDKGQKEAGVALGFNNFQTFYYIILPQALRRILPVYKGEVVSLVKMTSIIGYIAVQDLTKSGDIIRSRTFDAFFPLIFVAIIYFLLSFIVSKLIGLIEKKYERHN